MSCAHGTAKDAISCYVPFARDTPCQTTEFLNMVHVYFKIYSSDSVETKSTEAESALDIPGPCDASGLLQNVADSVASIRASSG